MIRWWSLSVNLSCFGLSTTMFTLKERYNWIFEPTKFIRLGEATLGISVNACWKPFTIYEDSRSGQEIRVNMSHKPQIDIHRYSHVVAWHPEKICILWIAQRSCKQNLVQQKLMIVRGRAFRDLVCGLTTIFGQVDREQNTAVGMSSVFLLTPDAGGISRSLNGHDRRQRHI